MNKNQKRKKATAKKPVKQLKPLSLKEPADKSDLAKVVGGLAGTNHNETFIVL